jgi:hypothetical protein
MTDTRHSDNSPAPTTPAKPKESSSRQQRRPDESKHSVNPEHASGDAGKSRATTVPPNAK